ncbi:DUF6361 family protein [Parasphingorhabdus sp.]|uniref:DUF6361 family protein n=1 Tax=Parasphingorhabdus sp. TaxID=2709688 RepID=UPI003001CF4C
MNSSIGWIRFDQREYDQAAEARALLTTPGSRDELGFAGIRDSFADAMFPGTSTIQTRMRYAIFVGWTYDRLIRLPSAELIKRGRNEEIETIRRLEKGRAGNGIIGSRAGEDLIRLPSMSYWTLLQQWRSAAIGDNLFPSRITWMTMDPCERKRWPLMSDTGPRSSFKQSMNFILPQTEIDYLAERLAEREKGGSRSLFHELLKGDARVTSEFPELADIVTDDVRNSEILRRARAFSELTWGASLAYNILLLEKRLRQARGSEKTVEEDEELLESRRKDWLEWIETDRQTNARMVTDPSFFSLPNCTGDKAIGFVNEWAGLSVTLTEPQGAAALISKREASIKSRTQQRFSSQRALSRWGGASDITAAAFRWPTARTFLRDLRAKGFPATTDEVA